MVKIVTQPLNVDALRVYQKNSPSKWADKFGDLDLDNIPEEYMKIRTVNVLNQDGTHALDGSGREMMREEEFFDAIQYRKDLIAKNRPKTPIMEELKDTQPVVVVDSSPVQVPSSNFESKIGQDRI